MIRTLEKNGNTVVFQNAGPGLVRVGQAQWSEEDAEVVSITGDGHHDWQMAEAVACLFYSPERHHKPAPDSPFGMRENMVFTDCSGDDIREIRQLLRKVAQCG